MYVQEANDRAEIVMRDREDREARQMATLENAYRQEWLNAVTTKPLESLVLFDERTDWDAVNELPLEAKAIGKHLPTRKSTVLDLFTDQCDYKDFDARVAKIVIDAHKAGNVEATKLLNDMAAAFAGSKI